MEVDARGAGGDHGVVARCAGNLERGHDNQPGTEQLLRMAIESVQVHGSSQAGQAEVQIRWRSGTITSLNVKRAARGEYSLKTPEEAVARIHKMVPRRTYAEIATALNRAGLRGAFGRRFTSQHVGYV